MSILVVDDEAEIRQLISAVLTEEGYTVAQATNGREALAYLRAAPTLPCVILLDLMMPIMNGWEFLRARQNYPLLATIPTVAISAVRTFATATALDCHGAWCPGRARQTDRPGSLSCCGPAVL
jgi:CheY-like chemotaxis protein